MKYILGILVVLFVIVGIYTVVNNNEPSKAFLHKVDLQQNPFTVPSDSANIIWKRASTFVETRKGWIGGGEIHRNNNLIFIPYSNSFYRGTSLRIEKSILGDSTVFQISWWYSKELSHKLSNEIALYMRTGIDRYHYK
ncbi:MAG: hypothetical protein K2Q21_09875 [Chitinophagaceae bacterium]|nr:hypothetical protein [Chitinophagaceae bacterium]